MIIKLLNSPSLDIVIRATRTCYDSKSIGPEADKELIKSIIKRGHTSVIEHAVYSFYISGISRACLQQLVRHRIGSFSVQSTRYTLRKKLKYADDWTEIYVRTGHPEIDGLLKKNFEDLQLLVSKEVKNDILKYLISESLKTELIWTVNARSLRNFLKLRLDKKAHTEIRSLALMILAILSEEDTSILFEDIQEEL